MPITRMAVLDFSGTLSLEAVAFGRPDRLCQALIASGVEALGVGEPALFWEAVVNPTWTEGSTTRAGYGAVLARRITAWRREQGLPEVSLAAAEAASGRFVSLYLGHSRIASPWKPLLARLSRSADAAVVIATDHYAEATEAILRRLRAWGLQARAAREPLLAGSPPGGLIVANSADLGVHKASPRFWEELREGLSLQEVRRILLCDDFGANEQEGDRYAEASRVAQRRQATTALLAGVFQAEVTVLPFAMERQELADLRAAEAACRRRIRGAEAEIGAFLA